MLKIVNLKDKQEYIYEVALLTQKQWGKNTYSKEEFEEKIKNKIEKIKKNFDNEYYCKLILLDEKELLGFISIFPQDCEERKNIYPWYSTMYVKQKHRGNGYSKILNDAILKEAKKRKFKRIYLKTELENFYEKYGAKFLEMLDNKEKIYYFDL